LGTGRGGLGTGRGGLGTGRGGLGTGRGGLGTGRGGFGTRPYWWSYATCPTFTCTRWVWELAVPD